MSVFSVGALSACGRHESLRIVYRRLRRPWTRTRYAPVWMLPSLRAAVTVRDSSGLNQNSLNLIQPRVMISLIIVQLWLDWLWIWIWIWWTNFCVSCRLALGRDPNTKSWRCLSTWCDESYQNFTMKFKKLVFYFFEKQKKIIFSERK